MRAVSHRSIRYSSLEMSSHSQLPELGAKTRGLAQARAGADLTSMFLHIRSSSLDASSHSRLPELGAKTREEGECGEEGESLFHGKTSPRTHVDSCSRARSSCALGFPSHRGAATASARIVAHTECR